MEQPTDPRFGVHRELIAQLTRRDLVSRYRGSVFGFLWMLLIPLLMLIVYSTVFTQVFKARWPDMPADSTAFAIMLFLGLIVHNLLSECLQKAPGLVLNEAHLVKKLVFPLDVLAWTTVTQATLHALCSLFVLAGLLLAFGYGLHWTILLLPLVLTPFLMLTVATIWLLSALGVYFRDLSQLMGLVSTLLLFISPVFYPVESLPDWLHPYIYLNPLSLIIEQARLVVVHGLLPDWSSLGIYTLVSCGLFLIAHALFVRAARGFADVL